ncbi:GGDEF domain-containing protein [Thermosulfidibacter takaii]|nr:GGDEF domain-containing protein [Thermosulfidibacter takaii]
MEEVAKLIEAADSGRVDQKEIAVLSEATRKALKFMIQNSIPITPKNFEQWFLTFLYLLVHKLDEDESQIKKAHEEALSYLRKVSKEVQEVKKVRQQTDEILSFSYDQIGRILEIVKAHNHQLSDQLENLTKGLEEKSIEVLINTLINHVKELRETNSKLQKELERTRLHIRVLKNKLNQTLQQANTDPLTGLHNRYMLINSLIRKIKHHEQTGEIFSFIMADIDDFKRVNDLYGHLAGDQVLVTFAEILKKDLRMDDIAARYGGEEFSIILSNLGIKEAIAVANRLRERLENTPVIWGDEIINVTASFGVAQVRKGDTPQSLIERADKALYLAKSDGKNCVRSEFDALARKLL